MEDLDLWHVITEPHPNGEADNVELMDVLGRIYQAPGKVILDGKPDVKPVRPSCKVLAWRVK